MTDLANYNEDDVVEMLEKVNQSVVNIGTVKLIQRNLYRAEPVKGTGSGTIIDSDGLILTNKHVVLGARKIGITLTDGKVVKGTVVGDCTTQDIAIVKVNKKNLPAVELGDSDKLRVGQRVFAIGNPFGFAGSPAVTSGVVSALNRSINTRHGMLENLIQTDAAINPGNSGGPLINLKGQVIAINTALIPFAKGIGFAIPVNDAAQCATEIIDHGSRIKPRLGIKSLTITKDAASYYDLPTDKGVFLARVLRGSPAAKSGIKPGDIVLKFDDKPINTAEELVREIQKRKVGEKVALEILRNTKKRKVEVILERTP